ncbi:MAG TPA: hypothetical protein VF708_20540 [Pyrinomonadaceae bacterium]|jgi:predicted transcriptional regulator
MKEVANSFAQLIAIIMITLVLAVSTAAVSQWVSADAGSNAGASALSSQSPALLVSDAR